MTLTLKWQDTSSPLYDPDVAPAIDTGDTDAYWGLDCDNDGDDDSFCCNNI